MKKCSKCKIEKTFDCFYKSKKEKFGLTNSCKECQRKIYLLNREQKKTYNKEYREKNKDTLKQKKSEYYHNTKDINSESRKISRDKNKYKKAEYDKEYKKKNKEIISLKRKVYSDNRKEEKSVYDRLYRDKNKEKLAENHKKYAQEHRQERRNYLNNLRKNNLNHKIAGNLRTRLRIALKNNSKKGSAVSDLGCSIEEFKSYLETLWKPGMNWDNWGRGRDKWHIDHIIPLSRIDLSNREEFLKACNYSNMQPLWAIENHRKGNRICQSVV